MNDLTLRTLCGWLLALASAVALPASLHAQVKDRADKPPAWKTDPYESTDPETMKAAGYVAHAPFRLGDDHDTADVERLLGTVKVIWIETEHFKIGSALPPFEVPVEKKIRAKISDELKRLQTKLPKVKPTARTLDPWLRLHLFAQRCEDQYADFQKRMGVTDADFPQTPDRGKPEDYRGEGPYLGMRGKFTVLLFEKSSALARYGERWLGGATLEAKRHLFHGDGSLLIALATENPLGGAPKNDTELHAHLAFNLAHNLLDGFKFFWYQLPVWWNEGVAHWYSRRIDPQYISFSGMNEDVAAARREWDWPPKIRARLKFDHYTKADELMSRFDFAKMSFADHMMAWSRVDYLFSLGDEGIAKFTKMMKGKIPMAGATPTHDEILARQKDALLAAFGLDAAGLDEAWKKHVMAKYPAK